jgi:hypothetical protein
MMPIKKSEKSGCGSVLFGVASETIEDDAPRNRLEAIVPNAPLQIAEVTPNDSIKIDRVLTKVHCSWL